MAEDQDQLGKVIKLFDINADGFDDILLGVYNEDIGNHLDAGLVQVVFGNAAGEIEQKNNYFCKQQNSQCGSDLLFDNFGSKQSLIISANAWNKDQKQVQVQVQVGRIIQVTTLNRNNTVLDSL